MLKFIDGLFYKLYSIFKEELGYLPSKDYERNAASILGLLFSELVFGCSHFLGFNLIENLGGKSLFIPFLIIMAFQIRYWFLDRRPYIKMKFQHKKGWLVLLVFSIISTVVFFFSL